MDLRLQRIPQPVAGPRPSRCRLAAARCGFVLLALLSLAGSAGAGVGDYPEPLYLSGTSASVVTDSHRLMGSGGPGALAAPTATAIAGGSLSGSYSYVYTIVDGVGGESAPSAVSNTASTSLFTGVRQFSVSGLPTGVDVRLYRKKSGRFNFLVDLPNNGSSTYSPDNASDAVVNANPILPQAENRVAFNLASPVTGYAEFRPAAPVSSVTTDNTTVTAAASTTPTGFGWIVDGPGNVAFAAGAWTLRVQTKSVNGNGTAHLVFGVWKVKTTDGAISESTLVLDPNDPAAESGTNLITSANTTQTITHTVSLPTVELQADEHLYFQLWRRQTAAYTSSGATESRVVTLYAYDGVGRLEHPLVSTLPDDPVLVSPLDRAEFVPPGSPQLEAAYSDPDGDAGTVDFLVCATRVGGAGSDCADVVASGSSASVASGATGSWTSPGLPHGTYYWQARATDAVGGGSAWTPTRRFEVNLAPARPVLRSPASGAWVRTGHPALRATFADPEGDPGTVRFRLCRRAASAGAKCSGLVTRWLSPLQASGSTTGWTVGKLLGDRRYHWQARSIDATGATSKWTATRQLEVAKRLVRVVSATHVKCAVGSWLGVRVRLAAAADITAIFTTHSRRDLVKEFGPRARGIRGLRMRIPYTLERPTVYWVAWQARREGEIERSLLRIDLRALRPGEVDPPPCRPA
jgi:hypothetical protein